MQHHLDFSPTMSGPGRIRCKATSSRQHSLAVASPRSTYRLRLEPCIESSSSRFYKRVALSRCCVLFLQERSMSRTWRFFYEHRNYDNCYIQSQLTRCESLAPLVAPDQCYTSIAHLPRIEQSTVHQSLTDTGVSSTLVLYTTSDQ